jgi:hypothetical protein
VYGLRPLNGAPALSKAVRALLPCIQLADARWSVLDTFDSVTPSYQSAHEVYEVFEWLRGAGFGEIEPSDWGFPAFRARVHGGVATASGTRRGVTARSFAP